MSRLLRVSRSGRLPSLLKFFTRKEVRSMSSQALQNATKSIIEGGITAGISEAAPSKATADFGSLTFSDAVQRERLPKDVYKALRKTITQGAALDASVADVVA